MYVLEDHVGLYALDDDGSVQGPHPLDPASNLIGTMRAVPSFGSAGGSAGGGGGPAGGGGGPSGGEGGHGGGGGVHGYFPNTPPDIEGFLDDFSPDATHLAMTKLGPDVGMMHAAEMWDNTNTTAADNNTDVGEDGDIDADVGYFGAFAAGSDQLGSSQQPSLQNPTQMNPGWFDLGQTGLAGFFDWMKAKEFRKGLRYAKNYNPSVKTNPMGGTFSLNQATTRRMRGNYSGSSFSLAGVNPLVLGAGAIGLLLLIK